MAAVSATSQASLKLLILCAVVAWLAHRRVAPAPALGIVAVYLIFMGLFSHAHGWMILLWLPWLLPVLPRRNRR